MKNTRTASAARTPHDITQTHGVDRRTILKAGAWAAPVIALAASTPMAAASVTPRGKSFTCGSSALNDNGTYTILENDDGTYAISVLYKTAPDIYEINLRLENGLSESYGTNYGTAPKPGSTSWDIVVSAKPLWIQVHTFNSHFGESTCPAPLGW